MIYCSKLKESIDSIYDAKEYNIDYEKMRKDELFNGISEELKKNLIDMVEVHENIPWGYRENSLKLIVYPKRIFDDKLKIISNILDRENISSIGKSEILKLFIEDQPDLIQTKKYI